MTDDIVERLREKAQFFRGSCEWPATANALGEAADEIEELRAALDEMRAELLQTYQRAWEKEAKP